MSYISRIEEEQKLQQTQRNKEKKSARRIKAMVIAALVLSSASLVLSTFAASSVIKGKETGYGSATVVSPKFVGPAVPATSEEAPAISDADDAVMLDSKGEGKPEKPVAKADKTASQKIVYLTFDDGPSKYTDQIVNILNQNGIHATFFMIGSQFNGHEKAMKTAAENGNYVGLHSMTHDKKKLYRSGNSAKFIKEFKQEQALVKKITGTTPWLIRAPYGSMPEIGAEFRDDIAAAKFKMWDWTVDSKDWSYPGKPDRIIQEVKRQVHRNTEVILMHEKAQTVKVLPEVISYLQKKGYSFAVYKPDQHFSVNFAKDQRL